jgi:hypothetical protein
MRTGLVGQAVCALMPVLLSASSAAALASRMWRFEKAWGMACLLLVWFVAHHSDVVWCAVRVARLADVHRGSD